ncbi:MAG TPA: dipicolinate synthase subunit B [Clostridia bacterium]|nr:dipicolinate synthase subunit B [Clostridia bacterium]
MGLQGLKIGFALTGSYCTFEKILPQVEELVKKGAEVFPIVSYSVSSTGTRFGESAYWLDRLREITKKKEISTMVDAEPIGPGGFLDLIIVAPCTGNTLAKLANGISDTPVLMALKAQLRNHKPVVLAISTNDGLSMNAKNLGLLLNTRNIYFVPFGQDNPKEKQNSLVAHMDRILETIFAALEGRQLQPLLVEYK